MFLVCKSKFILPFQYSTWDEVNFGAVDGINTNSAFYTVDNSAVKGDRERLLKHLQTPYVELNEVRNVMEP